MVNEVITDNNGRATGVSFINKENGKDYKIKGKIVVLAASACATARILLNSKSKAHPNGLGNSSNLIGKYLHDTTGAGRGVFVPELMNRKTSNEDGVGGMHVYSPWWLDSKKLDFPRGYHIEIGGGMPMPQYGIGWNPNDFNKFFGLRTGGYGDSLRDDVKKYYGSTMYLMGRGEAIPLKENYCEIDPDTNDKYGVPVLKFRYKWSDYEYKQAKHMHDTFEEIAYNMGGIPLGNKPTKKDNYGISVPGEIIHEVGTTRMGNDPKSSVVNKYERLHDVDNVYVVDAAPFVSQADKNPTWTIMALSMRTSEYIIDELKKQKV
jgi:choline dehydrogenase-like flavoprotein